MVECFLSLQADLRINAFTDVEVNLVGAAAEVLIGSGIPSATASSDKENKAGATGREHNSIPAVSEDGEPTAAANDSNGSSQPHCESSAGRQGSAAESQGPPAPSTPVVSAKAAAAAIADSGEWTEEQSQALLAALKQFGKDQDDRCVLNFTGSLLQIQST
jgi:hypothetical protein